MEEFNAETIGQLIKNYRKQAGLTQFELAEKVAIDSKQLGKIERGVHYPSVPTFLRIIKILNADIKVFYGKPAANVTVPENKLMRIVKNSSAQDLALAGKILEVIQTHNKLYNTPNA